MQFNLFLIKLFIMLHFEYEFTKEDYTSFYKYEYLNSPERKIIWRKYYIRYFLFLIVISFVVLYNLKDVKIDFFSIMPFVIIYFFYFVLQIFMNRNRIKKQALKMVNDPNNQSMFKNQNLSFEEKGIFMQNENGNCFYNWKAIIKKRETNLYYYLYINSLQAVIIPKRILTSIDRKNELENLIAKNISFEAEIANS
jgi:Ca2+/Na+ antiporter